METYKLDYAEMTENEIKILQRAEAEINSGREEKIFLMGMRIDEKQ